MDIFTAAEKGEIGIITELLAADPELVAKHREDGWTALHLASYYGNPEAVGILLANGADTSLRSTNSMENTPLHAAVAGGKFDVVKVLLENGIEVNATQHGGWTALQGAANSGDVKLAELLLAYGANRDAISENGSTALSLATAGNHTEVVELLARK
jgi:ankyrin repeat protein